VSLIAGSCQKVIDLKLGDQSGDLVIEANVTDAVGVQTIRLTRNVPFTNTNTYPGVSGAKITVTDQDGQVYPFPESSTPGTYTNSILLGKVGHTYTLAVTVDSITYTATSTLPVKVPLDSVTVESDNYHPGANHRKVTVHYKDPAGIANQYYFRVWDNGAQQKTIYTINDRFTDGNDVSEDLLRSQDDTEIVVGDTVEIEMQCIDDLVYQYWFAQRQVQNSGGGITPANPPSNITPSVLGYFSAHTMQTQTIKIR
jgi:hypothetical protein